jgi:hypothetical protein
MPRPFRTTPSSSQPEHTSDQPERTSDQPDAPFYRYDPNLGSPKDRYSRADVIHPATGRPEIPATFVAYVEGETIINTMHGRRRVAWRAEPGTPCIILGYWSDGTVHLRWPAIGGTYRVDGRFPTWVVTEDPTAMMAGGGRILSASEPTILPAGLSGRFMTAVAALVALLLLVALPPTRDALAALLADLLRIPR